MTLLIAFLLIAGFGMHWILYPIAIVVWLVHLHNAKD